MPRLFCGWPRIAPLALAGGLVVCSASAATFVVDSTGDEPDADLTDGVCRTALGTCTLRAAIEQANALAGADMIVFNIPGSGVHTIAPGSPLPALIDDAGITIDGYTQPGSSPNTLVVGNDAALLIELDGTNAGQSANGLVIQGLSATVRGLVVNRFGAVGVVVGGGFGHQVEGCFLGTDPTGQIAQGNRAGLEITQLFSPPAGLAATVGSTPLATIGGLAPRQRNLISGNSNGLIASFVSNCIIQGNYIGTNASGSTALGNQGNGATLNATSSISVGVFTNSFLPGTAGANVFSGNTGSGILVGFGGLNFIGGNLVGTDATGTTKIANGTGIQLLDGSHDEVYGNLVSGNSRYGIRDFHAFSGTIRGNRIGTTLSGTAPLPNSLDGITVVANSSSVYIGDGNLIAFNGGAGISVGVDPTDFSNDSRILQNSIHDNGGLGIDLGSDGVTPNNDCDAGRGPNLSQNYPVLRNVVSFGGNTTIDGALNSVPNTTFEIDFYSNSLCDPSGYGEGETFLGSTSVTTDNSCNAVFQATFAKSVAPGSFITATATDPAGNTSEFSACRPLVTGESFYTITPCRVADTRNPAGPYGGPALTPGSDRAFVIVGQCGIPADARAVAFNFAVTQPTASGDLEIFPAGTPLPAPPTVYYSAGQTRAKNAIYALGLAGDIGTHVDQATGTVHLVIDVTGYFR